MVASAGGLDAFKKFFAAMPADSGIAFVLIPHLDPKHESLMVELLARHTPMPVVEAEEGMAAEANQVYVLPPNKYMTIAGGILRLTGPVERSGLQTSIDLFLRSLADDQMEKAICIILSGTGAHGTLGLKAVKAAGGMAMVQAPSTAEYPRMPQSAIATGLADFVLPAEQMPEALVKYVQHFYVESGTRAAGAVEAPDYLNQLLALLRTRTKFDFRCYRKKMLMRRVERRMGLTHIQNVAEYMAYLREHPDEVKQLVRDLLISVTSFFRDPDAFQALKAEVIAPLLEAKEADAPLRVWVSSCATGEEAYSLAMLFLEEMNASQTACHLQVFATDVDAEALEVARHGVYSESIVADVSPERLARFFTKTDESSYQISKLVRELMVFAPQNLVADAPFSKLDLVSCRNLLIYLEPEVQKKVITLLHFALNEGGYLFLGPSEKIGRHTDLFEPVSKKWRIFRRIGGHRTERIEFPITAKLELPRQLKPLAESAPAHAFNLAELTQRLVLEELAPAAVLINRKFEILYFMGPATRYLDVPPGEPTQDLMRMARDGLRTKLRGAIHKAMHDGQAVQLTDVQVRRNGGYVPITVAIKPVQSRKAANGLLLIVFQDVPEGISPPRAHKPGPEDSIVRQLEFELRATKEDLQSTIEEMESSNEELKASNEEVMSMNEELQAANEELETSKEELQSLNEELSTVNNQLQDKVEELEAANNDMTNLLNCTDLATVFLDTNFRIRRFTPVTTQLLNLISTDLGRPLGDIAQKFTDAELLPDAAKVLRQLTPHEKEVQTEDGRHWVRRIVPYRTTDDRIEGVVLTFTDVTRIKQADKQARLLATILGDSNDAVFVHDFEGRITTWNRGAERLYGYTEAEALQMNVRQLIPQELLHETAANWARLHKGERVDLWETRRIAKDGRIVDVVNTATPLIDDTGQPVAIAKTDWDVSNLAKTRANLEAEVKRRTEALQEQRERLHAILSHAPDAIITIDQAGIMQTVNPTAERLFDYAAAEMIGQNVTMLMPPPYQEEHDGYLARYLRTGEAHIIGRGREVQARHKDGTIIPVDLTVSPVGNMGLFTGIIRDIRHRKALEREIVEIAVLEQQRIGQDLHDRTGQELAALGLLADSVVASLGKIDPGNVDVAHKLREGIRQVLRQVRNISGGLAKAQIEPAGLPAALVALTRHLSETSEVRFVLQGDDSIRLADSLTATHLFHIAQEACTNALKHAQAQMVVLRLHRTEDSVLLEIQDDGTGIPDGAPEGLGRRIMRNRASVIGAMLTIESGKPTGTLITCTLRTEHGNVRKHP
jgi:two-component system CheB/CheR fusion protein